MNGKAELQATLETIALLREVNVSNAVRADVLKQLGFECRMKPGMAFARKAQVQAVAESKPGDLNCGADDYQVTANGAGWWPVAKRIFELSYAEITDYEAVDTQTAMLLQDGWRPFQKVGRQWMRQYHGETVEIETLEGPRMIRDNDWLCVGVVNEVYPIEHERISAYVPVEK